MSAKKKPVEAVKIIAKSVEAIEVTPDVVKSACKALYTSDKAAKVAHGKKLVTNLSKCSGYPISYFDGKADETRKVCDIALGNIKANREALKASLKESGLKLAGHDEYESYRNAEKKISPVRASVRTDAEKAALKEKSEKAAAKKAKDAVDSAIAAGEVVSAENVSELETSGSVEEMIFSAVIAAVSKGWCRDKIIKAVERSLKLD